VPAAERVLCAGSGRFPGRARRPPRIRPVARRGAALPPGAGGPRERADRGRRGRGAGSRAAGRRGALRPRRHPAVGRHRAHARAGHLGGPAPPGGRLRGRTRRRRARGRGGGA
ncbi:MAG: hypothetical protein AVDCRST_MAG68-5370, partial [uncultured Gemmatimonadetes bacterium]